MEFFLKQQRYCREVSGCGVHRVKCVCIASISQWVYRPGTDLLPKHRGARADAKPLMSWKNSFLRNEQLVAHILVPFAFRSMGVPLKITVTYLLCSQSPRHTEKTKQNINIFFKKGYFFVIS